MVVGQKRSRGGAYPTGRSAARRRLTMGRRQKKLSPTAMMKQVVLKTAEKKMKFITGTGAVYNVGTTATSADRPFVTNALTTDIGTSQFTRNGDKIYSMRLEVKAALRNEAPNPGSNYRIIVVRGEAADMPNGDTTGFFFAGSYSNGGPILGCVNTDKFTVVKDLTFSSMEGDYSIEPSAAQRGKVKLISFTIPINKYIEYKDDAGTVPKGSNCYNMFCYGYDPNGGVGQIGNVEFSVRHYFKDV